MKSILTWLSGRFPITPLLAVTFSAAAVAIVSLVLFLSLSPDSAQANGASTIILDRIQGPYRVVVGIIPARPVIPQTHLAIQVFEAADERLLRDTDVDLHVAASGPGGSSAFGPQIVLNEQSLRYFEIDVPFDVIGSWDVSLAVSSDLGDEVFMLDLEVEEPRPQIQWIWITAVLVLIFAVGIWTWLTLQRRRGVR